MPDDNLKLLIGDGKTVEVRDVGLPIYRMVAQGNNSIPLHGFRIMTDDEAREFIKKYKHISKSNNLVSK